MRPRCLLNAHPHTHACTHTPVQVLLCYVLSYRVRAHAKFLPDQVQEQQVSALSMYCIGAQRHMFEAWWVCMLNAATPRSHF